MTDSSLRRAFVTGCGVVSPLGCSPTAFWDGLVSGRSALAPIRSFDTSGLTNTLAGEVADFVPEQHLTTPADLHGDRIGQYALAAAGGALRDAGLDLARIDRTRVGVIAATTLGSMPIGEAYLRSLRDHAPFPYRQLLHVPYAATATRLARALGVRGPVISPSIACASGTHAVGHALELIQCDQVDVVIAGGAEVLCHFVVAGFNSLRATAPDIVRPFDFRRNGLAVGEGAAILVVESEQHARAMRSALRAAQLAPTDVDFISAHGTGTVYNDAMEMAAIGAVFGEAAARIPVNSIKGAIGHTLGAAGSFEAIMCARILRDGVVPPTAGCEQLDPACRLDIVRGGARRQPVRVALSTSSAFAGNNAAIVLRRD